MLNHRDVQHRRILGDWVRARRQMLSLSRDDLAKRIQWSRSVVANIEQGLKSPTVEQLAELFTGLEIPSMYRRMVVRRLYPAVADQILGPMPPGLTSSDRLHISLDEHPTLYVAQPALNVVEVSPSTSLTFPGITAGTNLIVWLFTDPSAPEVLPDWDIHAHAVAAGLRLIGPLFMTPQEMDAITTPCSAHRDWDRMWNTKPRPSGFHGLYLRVRDPLTEAITTYDVRVGSIDLFPRPWSVFELAPLSS